MLNPYIDGGSLYLYYPPTWGEVWVHCTMGQQVDMWPKNKISSKLPQIGSKLPQDNPVHENIVHTNNKQTQNELFMFEVGGLDGPEAILLETGKSGKTDKWMYLTSEYISIMKD